MIHEHYKGFKLYPYPDKGVMMDELEDLNIQAEEVHDTVFGFIYKYKKLWRDRQGTVCGLEYLI